MFKRMPGQNGVTLFDIDLHLFFQPEILQEPVNRGHIVIILVLAGFLRFWFNQDCAFETDLVFVFDDRLQKAARMGALTAKIGV